MNKTRLAGLICSLALGFCSQVAQCDQSLIRNPFTPDPAEWLHPVTIGYSFRAPPSGSGSAIVLALGVWDRFDDGLAGDVDVGLWTNAGSLLAQVTISAGTSAVLIDGFRYESIGGPLPSLTPGDVYVLGAYRKFGVPYSVDHTTEGVDFQLGPGFDIIEERASSSSGGELTIEYPDFVYDANEALIGPNLRYVIPEPSSSALAVLAWSFLRGRRSICPSPRRQP